MSSKGPKDDFVAKAKEAEEQAAKAKDENS